MTTDEDHSEVVLLELRETLSLGSVHYSGSAWVLEQGTHISTIFGTDSGFKVDHFLFRLSSWVYSRLEGDRRYIASISYDAPSFRTWYSGLCTPLFPFPQQSWVFGGVLRCNTIAIAWNGKVIDGYFACNMMAEAQLKMEAEDGSYMKRSASTHGILVPALYVRCSQR